MTLDRAAIKQKAKAQLGNNLFGNVWLYAVLVEFIAGAIAGITSSFVIGILVIGPLSFGLSKLYLKLVREGTQMDVAGLFDGFSEDLGGNIILGLLQALFIFLWSLLFIIPGIVKSYAYSMAFYIKADHPEYDWKQCLDESQRITKGHKMELFILDLSFIGWAILASFTFGIGMFWLSPYMNTTKTNYYEALKSEA